MSIVLPRHVLCVPPAASGYPVGWHAGQYRASARQGLGWCSNCKGHAGSYSAAAVGASEGSAAARALDITSQHGNDSVQTAPPDRMIVIAHHNDSKMDLTWLDVHLPDIPRTVYEGNWAPGDDPEVPPPQHRTTNGNGKEGQVRVASSRK